MSTGMSSSQNSYSSYRGRGRSSSYRRRGGRGGTSTPDYTIQMGKKKLITSNIANLNDPLKNLIGTSLPEDHPL